MYKSTTISKQLLQLADRLDFEKIYLTVTLWQTISHFCSEISVVLVKHRNLNTWFCGDYEKSTPTVSSYAPTLIKE